MNEDTKQNAGQGAIEPVQLTGRSRFPFRCHKGLSCWNTCCHEMEIMLAPFDIVRLKNRLGLDSLDFLDQYTVTSVHEESSLPIVTLKMTEDEKRACPFKTDAGCSIYEDRPSICRYYPIGLGAMRAQKDDEEKPTEEKFYFLVKEDYCLGHGEEKEWTVDEWREDQGSRQDDERNLAWQKAFLGRTLPGEQRVDPRRQHLFFMACYNLDAFRRFVFESPFLEKFEVDEKTLEKIREDEEALLDFALRYMNFVMMVEETMKPRDGAVDEWRQKHQEEIRKATEGGPQG